MPAIKISDDLLAELAEMAKREMRSVEQQAAWLIAEGLRRREERAADAARKRASRATRPRTVQDASADCPRTSPLSPEGSSLSFPDPSNPNSYAPLPPGTPTPAHEGAREEGAVLATVPAVTEVQKTVPRASSGLRPAPKPCRYLHRFEEWYALYPKKRARPDAEAAWDKLKPDDALIDTMIAAVEAQKTWNDWRKNGGEFIPYPASWLNGKKWTDENAVVDTGLGSPTGRASPNRNVTDEAIHGFLAKYGGSP